MHTLFNFLLQLEMKTLSLRRERLEASLRKQMPWDTI
jgi:hypothetical protein